MKVHVLDVTWQAFEARLKDIRREVFVAEQNVPESEEWDGSDPAAIHFIAIDEAGRDLGCARLLSSGQIGRMAVRAGHRGSGIGADLLREAVKKAQSLGYEEVSSTRRSTRWTSTPGMTSWWKASRSKRPAFRTGPCAASSRSPLPGTSRRCR